MQRFHKFRAATLEDAYQQMRRALGDEALVVNTATISEGGVMGFFARKVVEVTAAAPVRDEAPRRPSLVEKRYAENKGPAPVGSDARVKETVAYFEKLVSDAQARIGRSPIAAAKGNTAPIIQFPTPARPAHEAADAGVKQDIRDLREMVQVLVAEHPGADLPKELLPWYRRLREAGITRESAAGLVLAAGGPGLDGDLDARIFGERLQLEVRKRVRVTGGLAMTAGMRRVIALAGPTGVGKTTNVAKLAAHFAIAERARVGLVTSDTYRIAATDQLKVYADIIGIPLTIVNDPREAAAALRGMTEFDAVFVDTAGGSPYNTQQLDDARDTLRAIRPDEVMLVLSASTPLDDMRTIVSRFSALRPTSLFFTKLDETRCAGSVYCLAEQSGLPLSYFSTGQNVPDDIEVAQARTLAKRLLEGSSHRE